jgi:hypothetical protein
LHCQRQAQTAVDFRLAGIRTAVPAIHSFQPRFRGR